MSSLSTNLQSIEVLKERNMAADLEERNMAADFGYPNLQSIEVLKERAVFDAQHAEEALARQLATNALQQAEILDLQQKLAIYTEFCVCLDES
jgi:hypothetical protein